MEWYPFGFRFVDIDTGCVVFLIIIVIAIAGRKHRFREIIVDRHS